MGQLNAYQVRAARGPLGVVEAGVAARQRLQLVVEVAAQLRQRQRIPAASRSSNIISSSLGRQVYVPLEAGSWLSTVPVQVSAHEQQPVEVEVHRLRTP